MAFEAFLDNSPQKTADALRPQDRQDVPPTEMITVPLKDKILLTIKEFLGIKSNEKVTRE